MAYFNYFFLHGPDFFSTLYLPFQLKKEILTKNPLNFYLLKNKKFHDVSVKNESARAKKN